MTPEHHLVWLIPLMLGLIVVSAVFSSLETALFSLRPQDVERLKSRRAEFAAALAKLMENPRRLLSALLLADALVNLPLIIVCLYILRYVVSPHLPFWVAALLIFALIVFLCDLMPKIAGLARPYRTARIGVRLFPILLPVFDPFFRLLERLGERMADLCTPNHWKKIHPLLEGELETLVELGAEEGALHATESEMIQEIIKLGDKTARDCMTPRVDAFAIPYDLTNEEIIPRLRTGHHRRVPVYGETPDEVLGVLDVRVFLLAEADFHYTELLTPPSFVPETMHAIDLLRSFLTHPQAMAIVVDEHGGTEGIITISDLVEEIISDAVPSADRELYIEPAGDGRLIVNGNARLDDINEQIGSQLEEEGIDTIGGLIFNRVGTLPKEGTTLQIGSLTLTVRRISKKRVEEVLIVDRRDGAQA